MNKNEYVFGANILENLTTGMYQDSKIIYREYIQNACDQIDKAIKSGLIEQNEGVINIWLDLAERNIKIEDNVTGIQANKFQATLSDIANSDKKITSSKGFRGIGRLCGLAYCKKLIFKSKASGENIISILCCDAEKMRKLLEDNNILKKYTATDVLSEIYEFSSEQTNDIQAHWFTVELVDINATNEDLLDFDSVKNYLSFTAPVQYQNTFIFRNKIYKHAQEINCPIDEYNIFLNGEQIFKKYVTHFMNSESVEGLSNLKIGEAFYLPMVEIVSYLNANNFTVYIVSGCEREALRALIKDTIHIKPNHIIGTDHSYTTMNLGNNRADRFFFKGNDELQRGNKIIDVNVQATKIFKIQREIGKKPVLAFGNSMGDGGMFNFTINDNKYKSLAFVLLCDDTGREFGNISKAEKMKQTAAENNWITVSMRDDWTTIYGDDVKREK